MTTRRSCSLAIQARGQVPNWSTLNYNAIISIINGITGVTDLTYPEAISTLLVQTGGSAGTVPLTMLNALSGRFGGATNYTTNKDTVNALAVRLSGLGGWSSEQLAWTEISALGIPFFNFKAVVEDRARVTNFDYAPYFASGTIRSVGAGQTYATISAAYAAAAAGDTISIIDGTYDLANETSGYLYFGTNNKHILVESASGIRGNVILSQTTGSFCIRPYSAGLVVFKNLTITNSTVAYNVYCDSNAVDTQRIFDNVHMISTYNGASGCYTAQDSEHGRTRLHEFNNCLLETVSRSVHVPNISTTETLLITNSTVKKTGTQTYEAFGVRTGTGGCSLYDSVFEQSTNTFALVFGTDTSLPPTNIGLIDIRGCDIQFKDSAYGHCLFLGRGTVKYYIVNNKITASNVQQASNISIGIKTRSTQVSDAVMKGNRIIGTRPFYTDGNCYTDTQNNIIICNNANFYGVGWSQIVYEATDFNCNNNIFKNNTIYAPSRLLDLDNNTSATTCKDSLKTGEIDNNKYCTDSGVYLNDTSDIAFSDCAAFWGNTFDANSKYYSGMAQPV